MPRSRSGSMHSKIIHNTSGLRTIAAIFEAGDEVMSGLRELSRREKIRGAQITGIGAFSDALLAYFDWDEKDYREIPVDDQVEVADRKSVVKGKRVSVRVDLGGRRVIKKKKNYTNQKY